MTEGSATANRRCGSGRRLTIAVLLAAVVVATGAGCATRRLAGAAGGPWEGNASWYGADFHGRLAADGSRYNMYELTAAHKTIEFGTRLLVTNLRNGRTVKVTITDRGPFVEGRIIDLSFSAAQAIGMLSDGVAPVRLEVIE